MNNYILWPSTMRNKTSVVRMRIREGAAGYGIYAMILEQLREATDYRVSDDAAIMAFAINVQDSEMVDRVMHDYGLFKVGDDGKIFSEWLNESMKNMNESKAQRSARARKAAAARYGSNANEMQEQCESNANEMQEQCESNAEAMRNAAYINNNKSINQSINQSINSENDGQGKDEKKRKRKYILSGEMRKYLQETEAKGYNIHVYQDIAEYYDLDDYECTELLKMTNMGKTGTEAMVQMLKVYEQNKKNNFRPNNPLEYFKSRIS